MQQIFTEKSLLLMLYLCYKGQEDVDILFREGDS